MSDPSPGPGYWLAADGAWYPPAGATEPAPTPPPTEHATGWWLASDGNWYPPTPDATDAPTEALATPGVPTLAVTAGPSATAQRANRKVLLAIGAVAAVVLLLVGGLVIKRTFGGKLPDNAIPLGIDEPPSPDLKLAPDAVVVRSNGGAAVKEISPNGTRFVLDAGAAGADQLQPGKTMVLTGVTSVKADKVERQGDQIIVTAKPATFPDVIADGRITIDHQDVDLSKATMRIYAPTPDLAEQEGAAPAPGTPGAIDRDHTGLDGGEHLDAAGGEGEQADAYLDLELAQAGGAVSRSGTLGGYDYRFDARISGGTVTFTLHLSKDANGIKIEIDVNAEVSGISFDGDIEISAATVRQFRLDAPNLSGHATITASATADRNATRIPITLVHVPMSIQVPFPIAGIPFTVGLDADAKVELAFSSRDSTVTGSFDARYSGRGGVHVDNGSLNATGAFDINWEDPLAAVRVHLTRVTARDDRVPEAVARPRHQPAPGQHVPDVDVRVRADPVGRLELHAVSRRARLDAHQRRHHRRVPGSRDPRGGSRDRQPQRRALQPSGSGLPDLIPPSATGPRSVISGRRITGGITGRAG